MAKRIIKPDSGNTLVLQEDNGSIDALTVETNGDVTLAGNFTSKGIDDNASSTALTIDSSGNTTLGGNLVIPTGAGISFPDATQINSATDDDATLSTYETGYVLNPIYVGGTQYNLNSGEDELYYIRIGDLVYLAGELDSYLVTNTATGAIRLKLPFTSASSAGGNLNSRDNGQRVYIGSTAYACNISVDESETEAKVRTATSTSDFSVTSNQRVVLNVCFCYYAA